MKKTETRYGPMWYYGGDGFIGKSLELYGEYSPDEIALCRRFVKPDWTIVSGGANIGALAVALASLVPQGKVYAFEPQPEHFQMLKRNAKGRRITVSDCALWHSRGDSRMRLLEDLGHDNFGCTALGDGEAPVRLIALDDWLQGEDVQFIMLDVEGCEGMALEGARESIKRCRPVLYLEDHDDAERPKHIPVGTTPLVQYLRDDLGYFVYRHMPQMYSPDNWKKCPENVFVSIDRIEVQPYHTISGNVLAIPRERLDEFRHVIDGNTTTYHDEKIGARLTMIVPRAPAQTNMGWAGFARFGGVGDNLISVSVARPLKEAGFKVEVITSAPNDVVFLNNPHIDKISVYDKKDFPEDDLLKWQDWFRTRAHAYAPGMFNNLSHSCEALKAAFPIQTSFWWPAHFRRKLFGGSYVEAVHDIFGMPYSFGPLFFPTEEEHAQAKITKRLLGEGPIIGWCLAGTRLDKIYPWSPSAVARLIKELNAKVVMMGAPPPHHDAVLAKDIMEAVKAHNGTTDGLTHAGSPSMENQTWPVRRILTLAQHCDLVITPDTGPGWGVAFEQVPKVVLLSHASPENITKHWVNTVTLHADPKRVDCWPCHQLHNSKDTCRANHLDNGAACISDISVEDIIVNAHNLLGQFWRPEPFVPVPMPSGVKFVKDKVGG